MTERRFFSFYLNDSLFGIDIILVREIIDNLEITPTEQAPENVVGLLNLRGQIVTILNPSVSLNFSNQRYKNLDNCIILKTASEIVKNNTKDSFEEITHTEVIGLLVDKIGEVYDINDEEIETPPANLNGVEGKYLKGVVKLEKELMMIIKISQVLGE